MNPLVMYKKFVICIQLLTNLCIFQWESYTHSRSLLEFYQIILKLWQFNCFEEWICTSDDISWGHYCFLNKSCDTREAMAIMNIWIFVEFAVTFLLHYTIFQTSTLFLNMYKTYWFIFQQSPFEAGSKQQGTVKQKQKQNGRGI